MATINDDFAEVDVEVDFNGSSAAMLGIYRIGDEHILEVAKEARTFIENNAERLPRVSSSASGKIVPYYTKVVAKFC